MKYDLIIIGAGAGGLTAASKASELGLKVALIEKEYYLGGDCLHYGCVPSKSLITASKEYMHNTKVLNELNIEYSNKVLVKNVFNKVKDDVHFILKHHDSKDIYIKKGVDIFEGIGTIVDNNHVRVVGVDNDILEGKFIFIATGSSPAIPPIKGLKESNFITNENAFDYRSIPESLLVIGGGPIGLELGQAFAFLGAKVYIVEAQNRILPNEVEEISSVLKNHLENNIIIMEGTRVEAIINEGNQKAILSNNDELIEIDSELILIASGRKTNIEELNLDGCGIKNSMGHIHTDDFMKTNIDNIYAVGDVTFNHAFTHVANLEAKIAIQDAFTKDNFYSSYNKDDISYMVYTTPQVYRNGLSKAEAIDKYGKAIKTIRIDLSTVDRFVVEGKAYGFVEVVLNDKDEIVGISAVGEDVGEYLQELAYIKQHGIKLDQVMKVVHPYPGYCEVNKMISMKYIQGSYDQV